MSMRTVDVQCRKPGARADELLDALSAQLRVPQPARWDETGHARVEFGREHEDARALVEAALDRVGSDWREHMMLL
jgi:hypothetical protein